MPVHPSSPPLSGDIRALLAVPSRGSWRALVAHLDNRSDEELAGGLAIQAARALRRWPPLLRQAPRRWLVEETPAARRELLRPLWTWAAFSLVEDDEPEPTAEGEEPDPFSPLWGSELAVSLCEHLGTAAIAPDGQRLVVTDCFELNHGNGSVYVSDLARLSSRQIELKSDLIVHPCDVVHSEISQDGRYLVTRWQSSPGDGPVSLHGVDLLDPQAGAIWEISLLDLSAMRDALDDFETESEEDEDERRAQFEDFAQDADDSCQLLLCGDRLAAYSPQWGDVRVFALRDGALLETIALSPDRAHSYLSYEGVKLPAAPRGMAFHQTGAFFYLDDLGRLRGLNAERRPLRVPRRPGDVWRAVLVDLAGSIWTFSNSFAQIWSLKGDRLARGQRFELRKPFSFSREHNDGGPILSPRRAGGVRVIWLSEGCVYLQNLPEDSWKTLRKSGFEQPRESSRDPSSLSLSADGAYGLLLLSFWTERGILLQLEALCQD